MIKQKPFKGVIAKWRISNESGDHSALVFGKCVAHISGQCSVHGDHIGMHTSTIQKMWIDDDGVRWCETKNSLYILIG